MNTRLQAYLENNKSLLRQNKIKEFLEFVYNDLTLTDKEKIVLFEFINNCLGYFNQPNSYNFEFIPRSSQTSPNFSGTVYVGDDTTVIKPLCFRRSDKLEEIIIPESVTQIRNSAFTGCSSLKSIVIPDSVTELGPWVFSECTSLSSVVLPDTIMELETGLFYNCDALTSIKLPKSLKRIERDTFYNCRFQSLVIPDTVSEIEGKAFAECIALESIRMPKNLKYLYNDVFDGCISLKEIQISKSAIDFEIYEYGIPDNVNITIV